MKTTLICAVMAALMAGCVKDPLSAVPVIPVPSASGVYIVNEGNFGRSNSTLSYYDLTTFSVFNDVFTAVNGRILGDVGTGMVLRGNVGYIVVNSSNRIELVDLRTNASLGSIDTGPGSSPRRLAFIDDTIALVTNLYENTVAVLDLKQLKVASRIQVGANPDGIAIAAGKAFVANSGFGSGTSVSVIDLSPMTGAAHEVSAPLSVTSSLTVDVNPGGVRIAPSGQVYVVCTGSYGDYNNPNDDTPAVIDVFDPSSERLVDSILIGGHTSDIAISDVDGIGYLATTDSVVRVDTRINRKTGVFLRGTYYSVGVEEVSGDVYLADPRDYVQPGRVLVFSSTGQLRTSFTVGIIPGWFAFKR